jgi:hypothetical protein
MQEYASKTTTVFFAVEVDLFHLMLDCLLLLLAGFL